MYKILNHPDVNFESDYNQIIQDREVKFAIALPATEEETLFKMHPMFLCRDYFNEVVVGEATGEAWSKYGFTWEGNRFSLPLDRVPVLVKYYKKPKRLYRALPAINFFEKLAGFKHTTSIEETDKDYVLVFFLAREWFDFCFTISFVTFLIRLAAYLELREVLAEPEREDFMLNIARVVPGDNDHDIARYARRIDFHKIFRDYNSFFGDMNAAGGEEDKPLYDYDPDEIHNYTGIQTIAEQVRDECPWRPWIAKKIIETYKKDIECTA